MIGRFQGSPGTLIKLRRLLKCWFIEMPIMITRFFFLIASEIQTEESFQWRYMLLSWHLEDRVHGHWLSTLFSLDFCNQLNCSPSMFSDQHLLVSFASNNAVWIIDSQLDLILFKRPFSRSYRDIRTMTNCISFGCRTLSNSVRICSLWHSFCKDFKEILLVQKRSGREFAESASSVISHIRSPLYIDVWTLLVEFREHIRNEPALAAKYSIISRKTGRWVTLFLGTLSLV